jgi:hypothetical protein
MNSLFAQVTTSVSSTGDAGAGGVVGMVLWLVVTVAMIVAIWKLFVKAGQPGWASIIPIYNTIVLLRITGRSGWWFLGLLVPFLNFFVIIRLFFDLARVFGRGIGFGFGLLFLFPIFLLILAFGDAEYLGPNGSRAKPSDGPSYAPAPLAP